MKTFHTAATTALFMLLGGAAASAQTPEAVVAGREPAQPPPVTARPAPASQPARAHRWYELQTLQVDGRYRLIESSAGVRSSNHLQHKQTIKGTFKFDPAGRYTLQALAGTGSHFTGSWENAGPGTGEATWKFGVRHLYGSAVPVKGLELQAGSLALVRGESTEITSYDNDGWVTGERVSVKRPAMIHLDEVSVTAGYLGDVTTPNVFERGDRLGDHNYTQALVSKRFGKRAAVSVDWTELEGVATWRQGIRLATKESHVVDAVRLELYQRVAGVEGEGFAVTLERALPARLALAGGFATIDRNYGGLNSDRFNRGRRLFVDAKLPLVRDLNLNVFYSGAIENDYAIANRHRFDIVVSYNALKALQRAGAL